MMRHIDELRRPIVTVEAMDAFNLMMQEAIQKAENEARQDLALALSSIKYDINRQFAQSKP